MAAENRPCTPALRSDIANEWIWLGEQLLQLPPKAFAVSRYLIEHPGRLVSKTELLDAMWADTVRKA